MKHVTAAIEFGTSKIVCVIGRERSAGRFEALGVGEVKYEGIKNGQWLHPSNVGHTISKAIEQAEKRAGKRIRDIFVGVPGAFCKVVCRQTSVGVQTGRVAESDIERLIESAESVFDDSRYTVVNSTPVYYILSDGNHYIDALGTATNQLDGLVSMVFVRNEFIEDVTALFEKLGIRLHAFVPDILAESLFLVPPEERDCSAVLLNVGHYDTNVTVVYGDAIVYNKTIHAGGMHLASDLSLVLNTTIDLAEQLKKRYCFGLGNTGAKLYDIAKQKNGRVERFPHNMVSDVIEARVEHLCLLISRAFEQSPLPIARRTRIFLSGGGMAMMKGAKEVLERHLKRQVRIPRIEAPQLSTPNYYSALALLDYVFEAKGQSQSGGLVLLEKIAEKMF